MIEYGFAFEEGHRPAFGNINRPSDRCTNTGRQRDDTGSAGRGAETYPKSATDRKESPERSETDRLDPSGNAQTCCYASERWEGQRPLGWIDMLPQEHLLEVSS